MGKTITTHTTGVGSIQFMFAAKALFNEKTGKSKFTIKVKLSDTDQSVSHLREIADYKVDTKTNRAIAGSGEVIINFESDFAPQVLDADNNVLEGVNIPLFDGRKDTGKAAVSYKVIDYDGNKIVRLAGIKLLELNLAPREDTSSNSMDDISEVLKNIG